MYARLLPSSVQRSIWLTGPSAIPQLLTLTVAVGTGGSVIPVMTRNGGAFEILGRPVVITEHCSTLGTVGDIVFADFQGYIIGLRKEAAIEKSAHVGWQTDETGYRTIVRVDGMPALDKAITPEHGTATLSTFVALETR
jgi:HK97 family phage major capsid protein